jgi:hypothetical protein
MPCGQNPAEGVGLIRLRLTPPGSRVRGIYLASLGANCVLHPTGKSLDLLSQMWRKGWD